MPISNYANIYSVLNLVDDLHKRKGVDSILDIGAGFGKYGFLLRERLDIRFIRYDKSDWEVKIDCVEPYIEYINPVHKHIYNNLYIDKISNIIDSLDNYDVILMIDCLEHLSKEDGQKLLPKLFNKTNKLLLLSFPNIYQPGANPGWPNDLEHHRCLWTEEEVSAIIGQTKHFKSSICAKYK